MYENKQVMDIQIYPGGCGMNFVLIAIILLALLFLFSLEVLIFCLIFLLLRNFTKQFFSYHFGVYFFVRLPIIYPSLF
jgi:hypothetical protein